jgi:hypothetical protein
MEDRNEKIVERVFDDAVERTWEEAKLRDLVALFYMWKKGDIRKYESFEELLAQFCIHDDNVRGLDDKEYFELEKYVVECICSTPAGRLFGACEDEDDENKSSGPDGA